MVAPKKFLILFMGESVARIRSIKPDFFRHEGLYNAERSAKLPLRLAFAGLWTAADREGRFAWQPRTLKLDCLPYDDGVNFEAVLDALEQSGFIKKYEIDGKAYGFIPSWHEHQVINQREAQSKLPEPSDASMCVHSTKQVQTHGEGKGRGKEGKGNISRSVADATRPCEGRFEEFWKAYPRRDGANPRKPAEQKFLALVKSGIDPEVMIAAAKQLAIEEGRRGKVGTQFVAQAVTWLNQQRWSDHSEAVIADDGMIEVLDQLALEAWDDYGRKTLGKGYPRNRMGGWRFPSKWPPGYEANLAADVERLIAGKVTQ